MRHISIRRAALLESADARGDLLPCVEVERAVAGSGRAGRAAGRRRRSHRGWGGAEGGVGGAEAGGQGADRGHGGRRCAAETGHGLRQLTGHLAHRDGGGLLSVKPNCFMAHKRREISLALPCEGCSRAVCALPGQTGAGWEGEGWRCWG